MLCEPLRGETFSELVLGGNVECKDLTVLKKNINEEIMNLFILPVLQVVSRIKFSYQINGVTVSIFRRDLSS